MAARDRILETNRAVIAAWNAHDVDALAAAYASDAEVYDVTSRIQITGHEMIRTVARERITSFPDLQVELHSLVWDDESSAGEWTMRMTHTHEYQGLPPTGNPIEVVGATFSKYDETGLVTRDTNYVDVPGLLRQLGVH